MVAFDTFNFVAISVCEYPFDKSSRTSFLRFSTHGYSIFTTECESFMAPRSFPGLFSSMLLISWHPRKREVEPVQPIVNLLNLLDCGNCKPFVYEIPSNLFFGW